MIRWLSYDPAGGLTQKKAVKKLSLPLDQKKTFFWVDIEAPTPEDYAVLSNVFHFDPLAVEDVQGPLHLPKVDTFGDYLFIIWYSLKDDPDTEALETIELDIFAGANYLVTLHRDPVREVNVLWDAASTRAKTFQKGADWLLHSLIDETVDAYYPVVDRVSDSIDLLEEAMFRKPGEQELRAIFKAKHQLLNIRKIASYEREALRVLMGTLGEKPFSNRTFVYFADILDHLVHIVELAESGREVVTGAIDIYLSSVSNRLNEVMKKLTVVSTIFLPLTFIAGVYGMNFRVMPEIYWRYGYLSVWGFMVTLAIAMLVYFRRSGWW